MLVTSPSAMLCMSSREWDLATSMTSFEAVGITFQSQIIKTNDNNTAKHQLKGKFEQKRPSSPDGFIFVRAPLREHGSTEVDGI